MEYYNNMVCVGYQDLAAIMPYNTLSTLVKRGRVERIKRGGGEGSPALIVYSSLPEKYRTRFQQQVGDPVEIMKEKMIKDSLRIDTEAREFYESFKYWLNGTETHLTQKLVEEYTINASVLRELLRLTERRSALRKSMGGSMRSVWDGITASSEKLRETYHHTLPTNEARLKDRIKAFKEDGYKSVISGKIGNQNTLKITEEVGEQLIAMKRSRVPVYTDTQLWEAYNTMALERGWKPLKSLSGLKSWLNSPSIMPLWYDAVHGEQAARQKFGRKHKTLLPQMRDALWYGDGTKLNLYYQDEQGQVRTTSVYEVIDAYSEVLLGYYISDSENFEAQYHAYRMAIQVSGHKPYEIVHDNQGGHKKIKGFMDRLCHINRSTQPYNGESKTIEAVFGRFQSQVLHKDWRFTGQNVTAVKKSSRPNIEFIEENKDSLYTWNELLDAYARARKEWNEMKHPRYDCSRWELYQRSVNEDTQAVTVHDMVDMFWVTCGRMNTFTDQGITITVGKKKLQYEVFSEPGKPDHAWRRRHTYEQFVVKYDPSDLSSIRLYSKDRSGQLRFERIAEPYITIHRAIQEQQDGEAMFIRQEQEAAMQDRIERQAQGRAIEYAHGTAPEQNGLRSPLLKGASEEVEREIDRRTRRYLRDPEDIQLGRVSKSISLSDWMDQEEVHENSNIKKVMSKM